MIAAERPVAGACCHVCGETADAYVAKWRIALCRTHLDLAIEDIEGAGEPSRAAELIASAKEIQS